MRSFLPQALASAFLVVTCWVAPARAQIISNLNGNDLGATTLVGNLNRSKALGFTIPASSSYQLDSVTLRLDVGEVTRTIAAGLYASSSGMPSGPQLAAFTITPFTLTGIQNYTFAASSSFLLQPSTTYFLVVYGTSPGSSSAYIDWMASSPSIPPAGLATFAGAFADNSGAVTLPPFNPSTTFNSFAVNVTAVPEAGPGLLLIPFLAIVTLKLRRERALREG